MNGGIVVVGSRLRRLERRRRRANDGRASDGPVGLRATVPAVRQLAQAKRILDSGRDLYGPKASKEGRNSVYRLLEKAPPCTGFVKIVCDFLSLWGTGGGGR